MRGVGVLLVFSSATETGVVVKVETKRLRAVVFAGAANDLSENPELETAALRGVMWWRVSIKTKAKLCAAWGARAFMQNCLGTGRVNLAGLNKASTNIFGEFDSGSERTLAAWIRHASRTGHFR